MKNEEMICNDCGNTTENHGSQLCISCRELRIQQIKEELKILES